MESLPAVTQSPVLSGTAVLAWRRQQLQRGGRPVDLDWLLDLGAGISWSSLQQLRIDPERTVEARCSLEALEQQWQLHLDQAVPLQHLVGRCPWRDLELEVSAAALIPRQETELLLDLAEQRLGRAQIHRWADLGTGSGALAVAMARAWPDAAGHAVDLSADALGLAERNLQRWGGAAALSVASRQLVGTVAAVVGTVGPGAEQSSVHSCRPVGRPASGCA